MTTEPQAKEPAPAAAPPVTGPDGSADQEPTKRWSRLTDMLRSSAGSRHRRIAYLTVLATCLLGLTGALAYEVTDGALSRPFTPNVASDPFGDGPRGSIEVIDSDEDGASDADEARRATDLNAADTDGDGMPDGWELAYGLDPSDATDANEDWDLDNLTNIQEYEASLARLDDVAASWGLRGVIAYSLHPEMADTDTQCRLDGGPHEPPAHASAIYRLPARMCDPAVAASTPDGWELDVGLDPLSAADNLDDADGDGFDAANEYALGTDPGKLDSDGDGLSDRDEATTYGTDPARADTDGDGMHDDYELQYALDPTDPVDGFDDLDHDALDNAAEHAAGTNPLEPDSDGDGMHDGWEVEFGLNPLSAADAALDLDGDGLSNAEEFQVRHTAFAESTDPTVRDTDNDGLDDRIEVRGDNKFRAPTNPFETDTDGDGLSDAAEVREHGTHPARRDTDGDALADPIELFESRTDPLDPDSDDDQLDDGAEWTLWTDRRDTVKANARALSDIRLWVRNLHPQATLTELVEVHAPFGDLDADGKVNILDADADGDGLPDGREVGLFGTDPAEIDTDLDTMPDDWELRYFLDPIDPTDANIDTDGDGLATYRASGAIAYVSPPSRQPPAAVASATPEIASFTNLQEYLFGTRPDRIDTDCDGMPDGWEALMQAVLPGSSQPRPNPRVFDADEDADGDGYDVNLDGRISDAERFTNFEEWWFSLDPAFHDTNGNGDISNNGVADPDGYELWVAQRVDQNDRRPSLIGLPDDGATERADVTQGCGDDPGAPTTQSGPHVTVIQPTPLRIVVAPLIFVALVTIIGRWPTRA